MIRKFLATFLVLTLFLSTLGFDQSAWASASVAAPGQTIAQAAGVTQTRLSDGKYPVQQASYDDSDGTYTLLLLNTKPGESSAFRNQNLPMARLTDEEIAAGEKSYLKVEKGEPALYLAEDFRVEYVHNVTTTEPNPQTGQPEVVVVRRESSFWQPFAGALAGQIVGNLLFTPHYYFPPVYQPGMVLTGYGSYGRTYNQAVRQYQTRYKEAPPAVQNRQFRTTGSIRSTQNGKNQTPKATSPDRKQQNKQLNRPTGSGYGNSTLRRSNPSSPKQVRKPSSSFGSSRAARPQARRPARRR